MIIEANMFLRRGTFLTNNTIINFSLRERHIIVLVSNRGDFSFLHFASPDVVKCSLL